MWPFKAEPPRPARIEPAPTARPARVLRFSPETVARVGAVEKPASVWTIPEPPPGLLPDGAGTMAMDRGIEAAYDFAAEGVAEGLFFPGFPYLAQLAQRPEYRVISETIAKEMTRKWIKLHSRGDEDKGEKLAHLGKAMDRYGVQTLFRRAAEHDGFFGRGQIYIDLGTGDDPAELATPLMIDPAKIGRGKLKGFKVIEPIWSYPTGYNSTNPLGEDFYRPTHWFVQGGMKVHASRLLSFVSREMPDLLKPAYMFCGLSLSQMVKPYVDNWLRTRESVSDLIQAFSVMVLSTDMGASLAGAGGFAGDGGVDIVARAQMFNKMRDNRGIMMLNKENETLANVSAPLGGLDQLQAQAQEHMASVAGIPLVKLLGVTPSGLNASSEGEIAVFDDSILSRQEAIFASPLRRVLDIIQLSEFGEIDPDIDFSFEPLRQMSELDRATIRKTNADAAGVLVDKGILSPEEERQRLSDEEGGLYNGLNPDDLPNAPDQEPDDEPEVVPDVPVAEAA